MSVEDVGVAAVAIDGQAVAILLEDAASFGIACTTYEVRYSATLEYGIAFPITLGRAVNFVSPACTILQPHVDLSIALGQVGYALQRGFFCIQCQVDNRCCLVTGFNCCQVALNSNILAQAAGCFAVFQSNIHVNGTVACTQCSITALSAAVVNGNCTTAVYRYNSTIIISMQAVAVRSNIYITVNGNRACIFSVGAALCNKCGNRCMVIAALAAVNISLQAAVYSNICFRCQNSIYIVVVTYGIGCSNIYSTVDGNVLSGSVPVTCIDTGVFACVISAGINNQLVSSNIYLRAAIIKNLDCCAIGTCGIHGQSFTGCINLQVFGGFNCADCGNITCFCELVGAVLSNYATHQVFVIFLFITGQSRGEGGGYLMIRNYRSCNVRAFTVCFIEGDVAGLQFLAACGQAVSNLHKTSQVLLASYEIAVGQLTSQCVQHVSYASVIIRVDAGVVGDQGYYRVFFCVLDNGVASLVVLSSFAIAFMRIVNLGVAAVIVDGQAVAILLEDVARFGIACAAYEVSDFAAVKLVFLPFGIAIGVTVFFVSPGSTIGQSQVHGTAQACIFFCIEMFVCNAGPCGILSGQLQVNNRFLAVARKFLALFAEEACITLNGYSLTFAAYINGTQSCAQSMEAIASFVTVVFNFDISCAQVNGCAICCNHTGAVSCDSGLAVNSYVCTYAVSVDAGNVSPGGFAQSSGVLAFDNVINSPVFAVLSHGQIAMQLNFGIAVSVNAVNIVIAVSLNSGVAGNLYHSLLACALSIDADCATFANHRVTAAGLAAVGIVDIDIQSACSNVCCAACNAVVDTAQRNSVVQNTCVFIRRNSLVVQSHVQLQSLVLSLNHQIFHTCSILYSCATDDEGACPVRIGFLMSHLVNVNACILGKYIGVIILLYAIVCTLLFTADKISKGILAVVPARTRIYSILFSSSLTGIFIEFNGIGFQGLAARSQTISNFCITGQVCFTGSKVAISQLACQSIQYISNTFIVVHINTGVIGNHVDNRACYSTRNNGVASCKIACCFAVTCVSVEDVGVTTVSINSQVIAVLLEDVACCCFAVTANEFSYMAAGKGVVVFAPCFIVPGCTVGNIEINDAFISTAALSNIFSKSNTSPGRILIR